MFYPRNKNTSHLSLEQRYKITTLVFLSSLISQLGIDLYTPSFPTMVQAFHTSSSNIQLSLTLYMFGFGALQLVFGYLADKIGRRPTLLIGYLIFIFSTVLIIFTNDIGWFLLLRFIQGGSAAAFSVCLRTSFRDLFSGIQLTKVSAYYSVVWALVPILAPAIGGYIAHYFNWQMQFKIIMACTAFFFILTYKLLPETRSQQAIVEGQDFFCALKDCLKNKPLILFSCLVAASDSIMLTFIVIAPFLLQNQYHLSAVHYGWAILLIAITNMLGAFFVGRFAQVFGNKRILIGGFIAATVSALSLLGLHFLNANNLWFIIIPMSFLYALIGVLYPAAAGKVYASIKASTGIATAVYGTIFTLGMTLSLSIASQLAHNTIIPYALLVLGLCFIAAMLLIKLRKAL